MPKAGPPSARRGSARCRTTRVKLSWTLKASRLASMRPTAGSSGAAGRLPEGRFPSRSCRCPSGMATRLASPTGAQALYAASAQRRCDRLLGTGIPLRERAAAVANHEPGARNCSLRPIQLVLTDAGGRQFSSAEAQMRVSLGQAERFSRRIPAELSAGPVGGANRLLDRMRRPFVDHAENQPVAASRQALCAARPHAQAIVGIHQRQRLLDGDHRPA